MLCLGDLLLVYFRQPVHVVIARRFQAEVLCEVDDFYMAGYAVLFQESCTLAVTEAEEHHVYLIERHL